MSILSRVLSGLALFALVGGPFSAAPAFAQSSPVATSASVAAASAVSGTVTDNTGATVAGAKVTLRGAKTASTLSDAQGHYSLSVSPGVYTAVVEKSGYLVASDDGVAVTDAGVVLNVRLAAPTFSSLQTIGRVAVRAPSRGSFNATPASVDVVNQQVFREQGDLQVRNILNQTPGIISGLPPSVNPASPGAITFPDIRGALSFETAALIDGHPLSVGKYGDYVTSFLNPYAFQSVEVIKGPGAAAPEISRAIGGTVNFRTLDPTRRPSGNLTFGVDSFGGTFSNVGYSNTVLDGKLGFVVDYSVNGTPGPNGTTGLLYSVPAGPFNYTDSHGNPVTLPAKPKQPVVPGQANQNTSAVVPVLAYGAVTPTIFTNKTELVKARYSFSSVSSFTASYLGSQTWSDQNGNNGNFIPTNFQPTGAYAGAYPVGPTTVLRSPFTYGDEWEINNEPIVQGEFRTAFKNDSILARYYHASIYRLQYNGATDPTQASPVFPVQLYGTDAKGNPLNGLDPYGRPYLAQQPANSNYYFSSAEQDKLYGYSFEYDHPFGSNGDVLTFATDQNFSATHAFNQFSPETFASVPDGSTQNTSSYLLRGQFSLGQKLNATAAYYLSKFASHFGSAVYSSPTASSPTLQFFDQTLWHNDARLGLEYRADRNTSLRFAAGSAVAPPYLATLSTAARPPAPCTNGGTYACPTGFSAGQVYYSTQSGIGVRPETSFGIDLGFDYRLPDDGLTVVKGDVYRTNLFNQFINTTFPNGNLTLGGVTLPLYTKATGNLSTSRYEGVELSVTRAPAVGFGYVAQGALVRGYALGVPAGGYPGVPGIVNGINFTDQSVSNQNIPYAQGYFETSYHTLNGGLLAFGGTYYGANNGFNVPAVVFFRSTLRVPLANRHNYLQASIDNLFNRYGDKFPVLYSGIGFPEANGQYYASALKNYGPRNVRISVSHDFGSR